MIIILLFFSIVNAAQAQLCVDLKGQYNECQVAAAYPEKVSLELFQKTSAGYTVYTVKSLSEGKVISSSILTDGAEHPVQITGYVGELPNMRYRSTCDAKSLMGHVWSTQVTDQATERFTLSKNANGDLLIADQTLVLGRVVQEKRFICQRHSYSQ